MDWLYSSLAEASLLNLAVIAVVVLLIAFGLRRWAAGIFTRLRWLLGGGPSTGALVDIDGYIGEVAGVGLTRVTLKSFDGSTMSLSLGGIHAVVTYPKGHQGCMVDIILPPGNDQAKFIEGMVVTRTESIRERFPSILREPPRLLARQETNAGQVLLRVYFPIWPGCGDPIEDVFRPQIADALKKIDPEYADWMIMVSYDTTEET